MKSPVKYFLFLIKILIFKMNIQLNILWIIQAPAVINIEEKTVESMFVVWELHLYKYFILFLVFVVKGATVNTSSVKISTV